MSRSSCSIWSSKPDHEWKSASSDPAAKIRRAVISPTISSRPTFIARPKPWCGIPATVPSEQAALVPGLGPDIHVLVLERDRGDQVGPAGQDAAGLRAADRLAAGEDDQIGPFGDEAAQIRARRQLGRGVDDHRQAVACAISATTGSGTQPGVSRIGQATAAVRSVIAASICQGIVPPAPG